jgi:hypothetical protein
VSAELSDQIHGAHLWVPPSIRPAIIRGSPGLAGTFKREDPAEGAAHGLGSLLSPNANTEPHQVSEHMSRGAVEAPASWSGAAQLRRPTPSCLRSRSQVRTAVVAAAGAVAESSAGFRKRRPETPRLRSLPRSTFTQGRRQKRQLQTGDPRKHIQAGLAFDAHRLECE